MVDLKIAVVTGANRGLGLEVARQLAQNGILVILTSRDKQKGRAALDKLKSEGLAGYYHQLDVTDSQSIGAFTEHMKTAIGKLDILINNAGIFLEQYPSRESVPLSLFDVPEEQILHTLSTNALGPLRLIRSLIPIMSANGTIINVSSSMGQLSSMEGLYPAYRLSKTSLNVITKIAAAELSENSDITINSVCPGWLKTDMGGSQAPQTVSHGADTIVWLALDADGTHPTGQFFKDRKPIDW